MPYEKYSTAPVFAFAVLPLGADAVAEARSVKPFHENVGDLWSQRYDAQKVSPGRLKWTGSSTIISHITRNICGEACSSIQDAIIRLLRKISPKLPYRRGISVACGTGEKEMRLLEAGIVEHMDCYELSATAIHKGRLEAEQRTLNERIRFHLGDALHRDIPHGAYDFVYWDNAMHHMSDVTEATRWSKAIMAQKSCFFMYDFVGPTRFQWTDEQLSIVKTVLNSLDDACFLTPDGEYMWKREPSMMTIEEIMQADPSEAADSAAILSAFATHFPNGIVIPLGGLIYVLGLDGILINIPENSILLSKLLKIDDMLAKQGHNYFAVAYCLGP